MSSADPDTSITMIERAKSGDNDAWGRLVDIYGPLVHIQCVRRGLQPDDAVDVTLEVFGSIFRSLGDFVKDKKSDRFLYFLRTIASRRIADFWRAEAKRQGKGRGGDSDWLLKLNLPSAGELTEVQTLAVWSPEELLSSLESQIWRQAKKKYGDNVTFQAFEMKEIHGRPVADIAAELEIEEGAVRTYASRVKNWIRQQLNELPDDDDDVPLSSEI